MEAFDNNETGIMLWDPDDVLVYINKATQDFINSLGATISIGIKFEDFTKSFFLQKPAVQGILLLQGGTDPAQV